ncbi:nucleoid-associated protein [Psychrosphaera sp. F3M07]|jgi:nucleoid-associated protein|uniref:Nucleoid-associated protein n=1 Tax=Psychrosphaera aquimarina TaxID=2044854 RepID=A0ABU3R5I7_9GAMM|nr:MULTISPECIES: nucleoid-associated protein [Psychrosphaera]MBU2917687.1 nucleoid-associated protein [Psychrosphaera sp. F3M07]MDU0114779.1 nucleoid-associated protein [Psychrosphaera aquimarina]
MSVTVNQFSIAFYEKREDTDFSTKWAVMTDTSLDKSNMFVEQLHNIYNGKPSKSYAAFSEEKNTAFSQQLHSYLNQEIAFDHVSKETLQLFQAELEKYEFDDTGYLLLIDYEYVATRYFMVGVVNLTEHFAIDTEFGIQSSRHLDLNKIQLAARIDVSNLLHAKEDLKTISFIKGRAGRQVNDFFMDLLGCTETINAKTQSKELLTAIDDFMSTESMAQNEKSDTREKVFEYCSEKISSGEDADLTELNETLSVLSDSEFKDFIQQQEYSFDDKVTLDKSTVRKLVKLSGAGGGVSISFDRILLGDRVNYNPGSDTLTIKGVPASLKAHLLDEFGLE